MRKLLTTTGFLLEDEKRYQNPHSITAFLLQFFRRVPCKVAILMTVFFFLTTIQFSNAQSLSTVYVTDKGMMLPRISLTSTIDITTVPAPIVSFLVYNTVRAGTSPYTIVPGFYYWNGSQWTPLGGIATFSEFYALMPPDNSATIAAGAPINFPRNGPSTGTIVRINDNQFSLPAVGTYLVNWQVSTAEAAQVGIEINGTLDANTVVGRATGTNQIIGNTIITTTVPNTLLSIVNLAGNTPALTITPQAGGTHAVSATLVITLIQ